jgi:hypothetical protein
MADFISKMVAETAFPGDRVFCAPAKMVICDHPPRTVFGGYTVEPLGLGGDWRMLVASLLIVRPRVYRWASDNGVCGWRLQDLLSNGMLPENWEEVTGES